MRAVHIRIIHLHASYMSRIASIKKAASREKSEIREATAYNGTMSMMRITILTIYQTYYEVVALGVTHLCKRGFL